MKHHSGRPRRLAWARNYAVTGMKSGISHWCQRFFISTPPPQRFVVDVKLNREKNRLPFCAASRRRRLKGAKELQRSAGQDLWHARELGGARFLLYGRREMIAELAPPFPARFIRDAHQLMTGRLCGQHSSRFGRRPVPPFGLCSFRKS